MQPTSSHGPDPRGRHGGVGAGPGRRTGRDAGGPPMAVRLGLLVTAVALMAAVALLNLPGAGTSVPAPDTPATTPGAPSATPPGTTPPQCTT